MAMTIHFLVLVAVIVQQGVGAVAVATAESPSGLSLSELIESSRPRSIARSGLASYKQKTRKSCLQLQTFQNCRVHGSKVSDTDAGDPSISGGYIEVNLGCCNDHKGDYKGPQDFSGLETPINVAGCEWSFSLLKEKIFKADGTPVSSPLDIVPTQGPSWLKMATATGSCAFNKDSQDCQGPFCDGMAVTITGNLYFALALSRKPGNRLVAPPGDTCDPVAQLNNEFLDLFPVGRAGGDKQVGTKVMELLRKQATQECRQECRKAQSTQSPAGAKAEACQCSAGIFKSKAPGRVDTTTPSKILWESMLVAAQNPDQPNLFDLYNQWEPYAGLSPEEAQKLPFYGGIAFIFMGQATYSSIKDGIEVEETGHVEYVATFVPVAKVPYDPIFAEINGGEMLFWTVDKENSQSRSY